MKKLLCFAAFAAIVCGSSIANAQCCAGRCVRGAGRVVAAVAGYPCATRGRVVYRSYSRAYIAPSYGFESTDFNTCGPVVAGACDAVEETAAEPCAPAVEYTPEPCAPASSYSTPKTGVTVRRYVERTTCPGGLCPLR